MEQVKTDYASNPNGDTNPLVWAWIGIKLTTKTSITATVLRPDTRYRWRVGVTGFTWSVAQAFTTL